MIKIYTILKNYSGAKAAKIEKIHKIIKIIAIVGMVNHINPMNNKPKNKTFINIIDNDSPILFSHILIEFFDVFSSVSFLFAIFSCIFLDLFFNIICNRYTTNLIIHGVL